MRSCAFQCVLLAVLANAANADDEITLRIGSNAIAIAADEAEADQFRDEGTSGGGVIVVCRRFQITRDANVYTVACEDTAFLTAAGVQGRAKLATFDLKLKQVVLTGDGESPVHLITEAGSEVDATHMYAERLLLTLSPQRNRQRPIDADKHHAEPKLPEVSIGSQSCRERTDNARD